MSLKEKVFQNHVEVERRNGTIGIIVANKIIDVVSGNRFNSKDGYTEDLTVPKYREFDIMKATLNGQVIYERDEVDWTNVKVDTPVYVKDSGSNAWFKRHFSHFDNGKIYVFNNGYTSWTGSGCSSWDEVKLAKQM